MPVDLNKITMNCPYGIVSKIFHVGINPQGMKDKDACTEKPDNMVCYNAISKDYMKNLASKIETGA